MKHLLTLTILLTSFSTFAQRKPQKIQFESKCQPLEYCKDCGDTKAVFNGKMRKYFEKQLNFRDLDLVEGVIIVQVAIDSTGTACPHRFFNYTTNTSEEVNRLRIASFISQMPKWQPAIVNGKPVNSFVRLAFYSKVDKRPLFDVDYLRNDKNKRWVVNTKNEPIVLDFTALESSLDN